ncbi:MAG: hypothetical protein R2815_00270 [Flavobacteriales bacterium]
MPRSIALPFLFSVVVCANAQRLLPLAGGVGGGTVNSLLEHNGALIIGGSYASFNGNARPNLQGWNGSNTIALHGAFEDAEDVVRCMVQFEGDLIVAGSDPDVGNIARWNGNAWSPLGVGITNEDISVLAVHQGALYAAVQGSTGGIVRKWNGTTWQLLPAIGGSQSGSIRAFAEYDGAFYVCGNIPGGLYRLNDEAWDLIDIGLNGPLLSMASTSTGLLLGGAFTADASGPLQAPYWALFDGSTTGTPNGPAPSGPVSGVHTIGSDQLILAGPEYGSRALINGTWHRVLQYDLHTALRYGDEVILGGTASSDNADDVPLSRMVTGLDIAVLGMNNVGVEITPTPWFFGVRRRVGSPTMEIPAGSMDHHLAFAAPYFIGRSGDSTYFSGTNDPRTFPCTGPHATQVDAAYHERYHQVWQIDRTLIAWHQAHWNEPGYEMPHAISSWPGNGDPANGEPLRLAPFMDLDNDGIYEPEQGEFPSIRGDQAVYYIQHDPDLTGQFTPPALIDRHIMHYVFWNSWDEHLYTTVFTNIKLINRSNRTYDDAHFGLLSDRTASCFTNDLNGSDTLLNLSYTYSALPSNSSCPGDPDTAPAAFGITWLSHPLASHLRLFQVSGPEPVLDMVTEMTLENLLNGSQEDGTPILDPTGQTTTHMFTGDPVAGTGWLDEFAPALPRGLDLSAIGPFNLPPNDTVCIDLAWVFGRNNADGHLASVGRLKQNTSAVRDWYQENVLDCNGSFGLVTPTPALVKPLSILSIRPNPASHTVRVSSSTMDHGTPLLFDGLGRSVQGNWPDLVNGSLYIDVRDLPNGIYTIRILGEATQATGRFVKE